MWWRIAVNSFIIRFGRKLNQAIHLTFKDRPTDQNKPKKAPQHIAFIVVCKGTAFYGYSVGHEAYLKVYLSQPSLKKRTADLLRHGAILGTQYDVSPVRACERARVERSRGGCRVRVALGQREADRLVAGV